MIKHSVAIKHELVYLTGRDKQGFPIPEYFGKKIFIYHKMFGMYMWILIDIIDYEE